MSAQSDEALMEYFGSNSAAASKGVYSPERRQRVRISAHWPVYFFRSQASDAIETTTQNLSSGGFYCLCQTPLTPGEFLMCTLRVPPHDASYQHGTRVLECRVKVMRSEPASEEGYYGIACQIEDYRFVAPQE